MNFKKIIAMTCSLALCAAVLTACGGADESVETTTAADTTVTEEVSETESETENAGETEADDVEEVPAETEEGEAETEADTEEVTEEDEAPAEDGDAVLNALQPLADAAMSVGEWPDLMEVTDEMMLTDYFLLDPANANYKNMLVLQCPMSAVMTEIIIIEAEDADAAKADLEARQKKAQDQDAFYPDDAERAGSSIVGTEGNYAYFILATSSAEAETALVEAIKAL